jgi:nitrogen fixation protein
MSIINVNVTKIEREVTINATPNVTQIIVTTQSGGGTQNLNDVLSEGNATDGENIFISNGDEITFDNGSRIRKGLTDAGNGGAKGVALVCSLDYELKWEAGRQYVMQQDGFTIREVSHNFTITPSATDDTTKGFAIDSRWILDNGDIYVCTDATEDSAVWELQVTDIQDLQNVTDIGNATDNSIIINNDVDSKFLSVQNNSIGSEITIFPDKIYHSNSGGEGAINITFEETTDGNFQEIIVPNESGIVATREWVADNINASPTLQDVTDNGSVTNIPMIVTEVDNSRSTTLLPFGIGFNSDNGNNGFKLEAETPTGITGSGTAVLKDVGDDTEIIAYESDIPSVGDFVPYNGATQDVDLGENGLKAGQLTLDITPTGTTEVGTTRWNNTIGSSETTLKGGNVILKNGVDLVARVVNKVTPNTTLTKASYQVVRISGAQGQRLAVNLAQANNDNNSADTLGIVTETIATNQEGFIMTVGQLENINTTGSLQGETWVDGDVLYLSPTTAGRLTNVKPIAPSHIVIVGYVEYAHANNGKIYVKVMNGWELDELHNVAISTPLNNQALTYETSTDLWKNKTIIEDSITDGVTTIAPSQNAVFDALALKIDKPQLLRSPANFNLINTTAFQKITANVGINGDGSFNVQAGKIYNIRGAYRMVGIGGGSYSFGAVTDGIATFSDIQLESLAVKSTNIGIPIAMNGFTITSFSSTTPNHNTSAGAGGYQRIDGDFLCLTSGKMWPSVSISVSHNGIVSLCNFVLTPLN